MSVELLDNGNQIKRNTLLVYFVKVLDVKVFVRESEILRQVHILGKLRVDLLGNYTTNLLSHANFRLLKSTNSLPLLGVPVLLDLELHHSMHQNISIDRFNVRFNPPIGTLCYLSDLHRNVTENLRVLDAEDTLSRNSRLLVANDHLSAEIIGVNSSAEIEEHRTTNVTRCISSASPRPGGQRQIAAHTNSRETS